MTHCARSLLTIMNSKLNSAIGFNQPLQYTVLAVLGVLFKEGPEADDNLLDSLQKLRLVRIAPCD